MDYNDSLGGIMMIKDINISIAAGEALLFLENSSGTASIESFDQFLKGTGLNVYLILNLLLSENLISITRNEEGASVIRLKRIFNDAKNKKELICF
jgi:hypothetical protein